VVDDGSDLGVLELLAKSWHPALEAGYVQRCSAVLNYAEKQAIAVVPGVASTVMRWRWVGTVGAFNLPVGLAFTLGAMTHCAVLLVNLAPQSYLI
jgi:hypothetical protein